MKIIRSKDFTAARAWGAMTVANMQGITTRLHWTDKPYKWHINEGEEVFAVLGVENSVASRTSFGGTAPANVRKAVAAARKRFL